jgi:hypothetical protein
MIPILQFGLFSTTFEHTGALFDLETAVRTAALVSVPAAFAIGSAWEFAIAGNRILVAEEPLRRTIDALVAAFEGRTLNTATLRETYLTLANWEGWARLLDSTPDAQRIRVALCHYGSLNQITWAANIVKEPLIRKYRTFLFERLTGTDAAKRLRIFLHSLIMPNRSYILRSYLDDPNSGNLWSAALTGKHSLDEHEEMAAAALDLARA